MFLHQKKTRMPSPEEALAGRAGKMGGLMRLPYGRFAFEEFQGDVADDCEVLCSIASTKSAAVFPESYVQDPTEPSGE